MENAQSKTTIPQEAVAYLDTLSHLMVTAQVTTGDGKQVTLDEGSETVVQWVMAVGPTSNKVMLVGNGGSSSVVSHVQNDLCKAVGLRALVFTEQPLLTALANDIGYDAAYEQSVNWWGDEGDLMLAVSSSGKSENILRAAQASKDHGCKLVTFSGFGDDNPLRQMGDMNFFVDSSVYGFVETAHAALTHFITDRAMTKMRDPAAATSGS
jgi:D-sedoheptulose 7-phosphate isomerase